MNRYPDDIVFKLAEALAFYGNPDTWFATLLVPDRPAGAINEDYSHVETLDRQCPGALARQVLEECAVREEDLL